MLTGHSPSALPRSTSDIGSKTRMAESAGPEPAQLHDSASFAQVSRGPVSVTQLDQSALNYSGEPEEKNPVPCADRGARSTQTAAVGNQSHHMSGASDFTSIGQSSYCFISFKKKEKKRAETMQNA